MAYSVDSAHKVYLKLYAYFIWEAQLNLDPRPSFLNFCMHVMFGYLAWGLPPGAWYNLDLCLFGNE
jgi:hypothetical protein